MSMKTEPPQEEEQEEAPPLTPAQAIDQLGAVIHELLNGQGCKPEDMQAGFILLTFPVNDPGLAKFTSDIHPDSAADILVKFGKRMGGQESPIITPGGIPS